MNKPIEKIRTDYKYSKKAMKYCENCKYASKWENNFICMYITYAQRRRPCPPGTGCIVKEIGPRLDRRDELH